MGCVCATWNHLILIGQVCLLPPILTIHGDKDRAVPNQQAVRLQQALSSADVPNQLLTIPGAQRGAFTPDQ